MSRVTAEKGSEGSQHISAKVCSSFLHAAVRISFPNHTPNHCVLFPKALELLGNAVMEGGQDTSKHGAYCCVKSSMVKFRKLPDNFAELVPVTIFDTED